MDRATRELVRQRAQNLCEYCRRHQRHSPLAPHQIEHVLPKKHGGSDDIGNLALACLSCNLHKGPNIAGLDPESGRLTELFNPRTQNWHEHFLRDRAILFGLTPIGRTTVAVLNMNMDELVRLRSTLGDEWDG